MNLLSTLKITSGAIEKKRLLKTYATDMYMKVFDYAFDPDKTYNLKFSCVNWNNVKEPTYDIFGILDQILLGEIKGNKARDIVYNYENHLIRLICNKNLDCGVSSTTINNVFGKGTIPTFNLQLAKDVPIKEIKLPVLGQIKYNGVRVAAIIKNGKVVLKTRNGKIISFPALEKELSIIYQDVMLDGELTIGDSKGQSHTTISGIVNSSMHGSPIVNSNVVYTVFDYMPLKEFYAMECNVPYEVRLFNLLSLFLLHEYNKTSKILKLPDTKTFYTHNDIEEEFCRLLCLGYEGMILKDPGHLYTFKRNKNWIKLKAERDCELTCISIEPGTGKYEGMIGALICEGMVDNKHVFVNVGTGLSDEARDRKHNFYLDKQISVIYNEVIYNKLTGHYSLFLPRYNGVRCDI